MTSVELRRWLAAAPEGAQVTFPCAQLARILAADHPEPVAAEATPGTVPVSWRERLWTAPADQRLNASEAAEALGMSLRALYGHTHPNRGRHGDTKTPRPAEERTLPFHRVGTRLLFVAGELRAYLQQNTRVQVPGRPNAGRVKKASARPTGEYAVADDVRDLLARRAGR